MSSTRYHWIPDQHDFRDFKYSLKSPNVPRRIDLRSHCPPVENQGSLGSCTAHALVGHLEYLENKASAYEALSRLFIYFNERNLEGDVNEDHGARLRDGLKALKKWGVCAEKLWPYDPSLIFEKPDEGAYEKALPNRISTFERLSSLEQMKDCLAGGRPFVFGFVVYPSFESTEVARTGVVPMPGQNEKPLGGHAVLCVGFDDDEQRILVRNSWGKEWGMAGYFSLPYDYVCGGLADDFWTIKK